MQTSDLRDSLNVHLSRKQLSPAFMRRLRVHQSEVMQPGRLGQSDCSGSTCVWSRCGLAVSFRSATAGPTSSAIGCIGNNVPLLPGGDVAMVVYRAIALWIKANHLTPSIRSLHRMHIKCRVGIGCIMYRCSAVCPYRYKTKAVSKSIKKWNLACGIRGLGYNIPVHEASCLVAVGTEKAYSCEAGGNGGVSVARRLPASEDVLPARSSLGAFSEVRW